MITSNRSVDEVRFLSRKLVREWGFMGGEFAGTMLPPSAVHALIEIDAGELTARDLGSLLRLEKSSVSRMVRKLVDTGYLKESASQDDARFKMLSLTSYGKKNVAAIHDFARKQVNAALGRLRPGQQQKVVEGLRIYANALGDSATKQNAATSIELKEGYHSGLIAAITHLHASYYSRETGFGQRFESIVAGGLAEFANRLENPKNAIWTAVRDGEIVGSVAIDGEDLGSNIAHLRWFIVGDDARGTGAGRTLLTQAMAFVDREGFGETQLETLATLPAARHLYESVGFVLVEERLGDQWGKQVTEQRFARCRA